MDHLEVTVQLQPPNQWCASLHERLPSTLSDSELVLQGPFGKGGIKFLELQKGLWVSQIDVRLSKTLKMYRTPKSINDYFILNFHLSKSEILQSGDSTDFKLGIEHINILLASSVTEAMIVVPSNVPVQIFNIGFTADWLRRNVLESNQDLLPLFPNDQAIFLSQTIDYKFRSDLKKINLEENRLRLNTTVLNLLDHFFSQLGQRSEITSTSQKIHPADLTALMKARESIENKFSDRVSIDDLARASSMSSAKFKRLFKQIFGTTPYRYQLNTKLQVAMELLTQDQYSVSQVGNLIGYHNLSQFSKAFKDRFGVLPKEVR